MELSKKDCDFLSEDIKRYGNVDEDGNLSIDSGLQKQKIGQISDGKLKDIKTKKETKEILKLSYENIITELHEYCDMKEEYYPLVAIWIIGTYLHKSFNTYPYLFINAMRGSGKTRLLKLIASLAMNGDLTGSLTEAVLFRIPPDSTLCIDEFEGITRKGNEGLRELLNACYKKGMKIRRMKQKKTPEGNEMVVEEFEPYKPICMANIWGMEEVLGDRCITTILEKSTRLDVMRIIEDFDDKPMIKYIKTGLKSNLVYLCSLFGVCRYTYKWNLYVKDKYPTLVPLTTQTTHTTQTTPPIKDENGLDTTHINEYKDLLNMFNKIDATGINGRNLELFFPLLIIGEAINENVFDNILSIASKLTKDKREEEMTESRDVALIEFISKQQLNRDYKSIKWVTNEFRRYLGDDQEDERWINTKWIGRALKRLNLIIDKRRVSDGMEITMNVNKAKEKITFMKG